LAGRRSQAHTESEQNRPPSFPQIGRTASACAGRVARCVGDSFVAVIVFCSFSFSQAVITPREISLGAGVSFVNDVRGLAANPAGLPGMRDWDVEVVSAVPNHGSGFVFDGVAVGKRLFDRHALAIQYSPATELDFVLPSSVKFSGIDFSTDRTITYKEPLAISYGVRLTNAFSVGVGGRMRSEAVSEPQLQFIDTSVSALPNEDKRTSWFLDLGLNWQPSRFFTLSALARGIPVAPGGELEPEFRLYQLPQKTTFEGGIEYSASASLRVALQGSSAGTGAVGMEWIPLRDFSVRGAAYADRDESPFVNAIAVGTGWIAGPLELEVSYLRFVNQAKRTGTILASELAHSVIHTIGMSPFTPDRLSVGVKVSLGNIHVPVIRILGVEMSGAIYPVISQEFAYRPVGKVRIQNIASTTVQAKSSFFIDQLMDHPTESASVKLNPGEEMDIPLFAVFNDHIQNVTSVSVREGTVVVSATTVGGEDDRSQTRVVIRGRNDWDGNAESLRFFVKPENADVLRTTRDILLAQRSSFEAVSPALQLFEKARALFNAFAGKLVYVNDPKLSADYVQYPDETLRIRGGDCDDMTVCFSSLLASVGISTAFVDVVPPKHPEDSHIYLMFDTGLDPQYADQISPNPKRYVIRKNTAGKETVWIPVESTVIMKGFEDAWSTGAREYYDDVEVNMGLSQGWVRIVDVD